MSIHPHRTHAGWYYVQSYPDGRKGKVHRDVCESYAEAVALDTALKRKKTVVTTTQLHPKIADIVDEYIAWMPRNLSPVTCEMKERRLARYILPVFGKFRVRDITQKHLDAYSQTVAYWTYYTDLNILLAFISWAKKRGYCEGLTFQAERPKGKHAIKPIPHPTDLIAAINALTVEQQRVLFSLMLYTGLRWGEASQLKWSDVDMTNRTIMVKEIERAEQDVIYIPESLQQWFTTHKKPSGLVFPGRGIDKPYKPLWKVLKAMSAACGMKITNHTFRHASATYLYEKTKDIYQVQAHLRHKKVTTSQIYARMSISRRKSAVNTIESYVNNS